MIKSKPLEGITIIDFGQVLAGPYATKQLLSLGATVIKVEARKRPDPFRFGFLRPGGPNDSLREGCWTFQNANVSKMGLDLNTKSEKAQEILHKLVACADVVTCNLSPTGFYKMGLGYEELSKYNKDIIVINASGMGEVGPYGTYRATAHIMQSLSGMTSLIGYDGEDPYGCALLFADYISGIYLSASVAGALEYRRRTGKGQYIDLSATDAAACVLGANYASYSITGKETKPFGNHHYTRQMSPHSCYPCRGTDSWFVLAVGDEAEWKRFQDEVRDECPWVDDPRFSTMVDRLKNETALDGYISEWTKDRDGNALAERLQKAGVSAAKVKNVEEILDDPHAAARHAFQTFDFSDSSTGDDAVRVFKVMSPVLNREFPCTPAPVMGQDNTYILKEMLGMTDAEIEIASLDGAFD